MSLDDDFTNELAALARRARLRETRPLGGADRVHTVGPAGQPLLSFCSNDYLGLASHPVPVEAARRELAVSGLGSGAARLVSGESPAHRTLEATLARYLGRPAALTFPTGYLANVGVITALAGPEDLIVSDAANHASIIDGCRLSRARVVVYPHLDAGAADGGLATPGSFRRRLLVTESLFSMDGDRAPLDSLASAAAARGAILMVDEAHALGTVGPHGAGLAAEVQARPDILVGTLGKAFGTLGGFASGSEVLRAVLLNRSRTFVYSTASPALIAAATAAAVDLAASQAGDALRETAHRLARRLRDGLDRLRLRHLGRDLIVPVILGSDAAAVAASQTLLDRGVFVPAIRPPTVPENTARLRITISALHTDADVDQLLEALSSTPAFSTAAGLASATRATAAPTPTVP